MSRGPRHLFSVSLGFGLAAALTLTSHGAVIAQAPSLSPILTQAPVSTTVLYVNPTTGNDQPAAGKTEAAPFKTITFALQQATAGTIIQLAPGTYAAGETFPLALKPGVILQGNESSKGASILIQGGGDTISKSFAKQNVSILAAEGSIIRGITVTNPNGRGSGIWIEDVSATLLNNTLTNSVREGVFITGNGNGTVTGNVFTQNQGNGISIAKAARGMIKNNVFLNTGFGLAIGGTSTPLIDSNQITQNTAGFYINDNARPVLRNNVVTDNKDGVFVTSSAQPDLGTAASNGNNTIRNNKGTDVTNSTGRPIIAIGNNIDPKKISGPVEFVASSGGSTFADVQGHWAQGYIQALAARNIITGFPDGTFKPNEPVTRAQFAAIILKAFAPAETKPGRTFSDVRSNYWAATAIQTSVRGGFMTGYPEGTFQPEQRIPRVQTLVALVNGLGFPYGDAAANSRYQDAAAIPSWAAGQVAAATGRRMVVNYPSVGQLNPGREATRAEVAAFVYQALVSAGKADAIASPYIVGAQ
jgi:parallel beta-helix repeat protein